MDFMDELEWMAQFAIEYPILEEVNDVAIQKWQEPFGYSSPEVSKRLQDDRTDIYWHSVSNAYWDFGVYEKEV